MARYPDSRRSGDIEATPDTPTLIPTNPRVKAILWLLVAAMAVLVMIGMFASDVL
ncbi:hypothetical protein HGP14_27075 [Rhizobium sp. P32RR-XVIII]|uniref:hypothetical protein n=1 Tax=Rhizobium sp. P32RR-XVIII TaxID=2726738 RepID=UPI001456D596|nr:hypothetical protein [Rhizobium sp. P32RR-XVIII]NLS06966.1 hypothetical protein [Rhizobium sp. P32RR-XVIII]